MGTQKGKATVNLVVSRSVRAIDTIKALPYFLQLSAEALGRLTPRKGPTSIFYTESDIIFRHQGGSLNPFFKTAQHC